MKYKYIFIAILFLFNFQTILSIFLSNANLEYQNENEIKINISSKLSSIKKIGRYYLKDDIIYLAQSGSSIEFHLKAKKASISIYSNNAYLHEDYEKPRFAIYLNDKIFIDMKLDIKEKKILLFNLKQEKKVKIKIIILSEALLGNIGIKNLYINNDIKNIDGILTPTENKKYLIEFIGDSITCGYGIESKAPNELFDTNTENFEKTYAYLSAKELDFDYSTVCYSGCGIITPGNKMPKRYTKINSFANNSEWNFIYNDNKTSADIIVINLGTNDYNYALPFEEDIYSKEYAEFIKLVRKKNHNAFIICIYGMMGGEELFNFIMKGIKSLNDDKVFGYLFPEQKFEDGYGAQFHPNEISHFKWSKFLIKIIKNIIFNKKNLR